MSELEQRIARLEGRASINDLVVRYFLAADGDDLDGVRDCFTADAVFSASGVACGEGAAGIAEFIRTARQGMGLTLHTPHYVHCNFDGADQATGLVGAHLELVLGGTACYGAVRYVDRYRRDGGAWRIMTRDMRTVFMAPWAEVGPALASDTPVIWPGAAPMASDFPRRHQA